MKSSKKLISLKGMLDTLTRGEHVQNRQLATWLSEEEYAQIELEWSAQKDLREELKDKPDDLKRYEDKLKEAIMMDNRMQGYRSRGKKEAAYKFDSKRESLCEDALNNKGRPVAEDFRQHPPRA